MDPALAELLRTGRAGGAGMVEAIIRLRRPGAPVPGVQIVSQFGPIATCRIPLGQVRRVRAHQDVVSLKAPRPIGPQERCCDHRSIAGGLAADAPVLARRPAGLSLTGAGVVVGIVDCGFDLDHPAFRSPDGRTRVLALWDQRGGGPRSPQPYGYGTVHSGRQIDEALRSGRPYLHLDYHPAVADRGGGAHATHVADIAAGTGRAGAPEGVAPGADLALVHLADRGTGGLATLGDSVRLLEAVDYIDRTAGCRPWVVNLSIGRMGGSHDGRLLAELALDELLAARPGRFVVQSAGNYYRARTHASGRLGAGESRVLTFVVSPSDTTTNELEIWYGGGDELSVAIDPPGTTGSEPVRLGENADLRTGARMVGRVYHRACDPTNGDHHIDAFLDPRGQAGRWTVTLRAERAMGGPFHAWLERDDACPGCQPRFVAADADPTCTTGTIANGHLPLVVGAYDARSPARPDATFSSAGRTRDGREKPDIGAPGVAVLAARSAPAGSDRSPGGLVRKSGTSMAAPHVTGAVALCLQTRPAPPGCAADPRPGDRIGRRRNRGIADRQRPSRHPRTARRHPGRPSDPTHPIPAGDRHEDRPRLLVPPGPGAGPRLPGVRLPPRR